MIVPGPPFVFGGILVIVALLVASFMPASPNSGSSLLSADDLSQPMSSEALGTSGAIGKWFRGWMVWCVGGWYGGWVDGLVGG